MTESNGNTNAVHPTSRLPHVSPTFSIATRGVHGDDPIRNYTDVAPALHVSTTFRYSSDPDKLIPSSGLEDDRLELGPTITGDAHIYSRESAPNTSRLELILSSILNAPCLTYASGLASFHALLVYLNPKVVAIGGGYHGCHGVLKIYQKLTKCKIVDLFDEKSWDAAELGENDVVHLETPINPTGLAYSIVHFAQLAHKRGAVLTVDATFAPPPLQDPFAHGADFVMHSGTKYFGGHSDMLCGVIAINPKRANVKKDYWAMFQERVYLGAVMGSMEGWLGVRSLRTYELRITRQSQSADRLVGFFASCLDSTSTSPDAALVQSVVAKLGHASLQADDMKPWLAAQMPNGFGPVFAIWMKSKHLAKRLPGKMVLFHHATSLGGVESLIEWRRMSDDTVEETLCRVSVGVEAWEDLRDDFLQAFRTLTEQHN